MSTAKAIRALITLHFLANFEVVQIFASRVLARLEGSTIFATFGPGGPGGGAPQGECSIEARTRLLCRRLRGRDVNRPGFTGGCVSCPVPSGFQAQGGCEKTIGVRFSQIRLVGAGLEPEKGLAGRTVNGPPSAPLRCRPTEPVLKPEEPLHVQRYRSARVTCLLRACFALCNRRKYLNLKVNIYLYLFLLQIKSY